MCLDAPGCPGEADPGLIPRPLDLAIKGPPDCFVALLFSLRQSCLQAEP